MSSTQRMVMRSAKIRLGFGLLACCLAAVPAAFAQYPTKSQVSKDGTAVMLEDYANPPLSSATHGGANSTAIDFKGQLGRVSSLRAEPANAPLATSRIFVNDQSGTLYILDTKTKNFTPYLKFYGYFPEICFRQGQRHRHRFHHFRPGLREKREILYRAHRESGIAGNFESRQHPAIEPESHGILHDAPVDPPAGPVHLESVLMEWTDTNIRNATFEGTARELLRVGYDRNHPMDDTIFDPLAKPGQPRLRQSLHRRRRWRAGRNSRPVAHASATARYAARQRFCGSLPTSICVRRTCSAPTAVIAFRPPARIRIRL